MTLNVTSPSLYALGTVTTIISFAIIAVCLGTIGSSAEAARQPRAGLLRRTSMELGPGHIELAGVVKTFDGFVNAVDGVNHQDSQRRLLLPARPVGLRQDHHPAHDRRT